MPMRTISREGMTYLKVDGLVQHVSKILLGHGKCRDHGVDHELLLIPCDYDGERTMAITSRDVERGTLPLAVILTDAMTSKCLPPPYEEYKDIPEGSGPEGGYNTEDIMDMLRAILGPENIKEDEK